MDSLYHRIRRGIENYAEAVALVDNGRALTYGELGRRIDDLAIRLRHNGIRPESVTAICVREPAAAIVAVLAVWAAGGAYLPLDADFPDDTLRRWLTAAGARLVLTEPGQAPRLSAIAGTPAVIAEPSGSGSTITDAIPFDGPVHPRSTAYVMFTSGSTGEPKGVAVEQHNLAAYHSALSSYVPLERSQVVLQVAAFTFDPWLRDALMPLTVGATVVCTSKSLRRNPEKLSAAIRDHGVTHLLSATPALLTGLITAPDFVAARTGLHTTLVSGESFLPLRAHGRALARFGRVVNHFGLTETTLIATQHPYTETSADSTDVIGTPLPGISVHLLDSMLHRVRRGEMGEIYIGGTGVSRGYVGAPGHTAARFVADPFAADAATGGARLYRTGDLGRLLEDGTLEYLGRRDRQINLRGHRVEPAEVELALTGHPDVGSAVVLGCRRPAHGIVLVGYIVRRAGPAGAALDRAGLRAYLSALLPAHMIPATYIFLDRLPLGATGKVDRSALPEPMFGAGRAGTDGHIPADSAPSTAVEHTIARAWSEVLNVPEVGRDDNFFDLGGHSLLAARIAIRLSSDLDRDVTTERILGNPTVALLAADLPERSATPAERPAGELRRRTGTRYPLSTVQRGLWNLMSPDTPPPIVARAFRLNSRPDPDRLAAALAAVLRRHPVLRCAFDSSPGRPAGQTVRHRADAAVRTVPVPAEITVPELGRACAETMDIARGQTVEVTLYEHPARTDSVPHPPCTLLVRCHRLVADEPALDILIRELGELYSGVWGTAGPAQPTTGFPEFARTEQPIADGVQAARHWQDRLAGITTPDPAQRPDTVSSARLSLPARVIRPLRARMRSLDLDLPAVLRTAFAAALVTGASTRERIPVCTTVSYRPTPDWESVIGPFSWTEPAVVELSPGDSLRKSLTAPGDLRDAAFAGIPVEFLCGEAALSPTVSANRLHLHPVAAEPLQLAGIEADPIELPVLGEHTIRLLEISEQAGGLAGGVHLRSADPDAAAIVAIRVRDLLTGFAENGAPR
ncbi:amino acid adenylation domain-containing protein [Nocardia sp. NPDC001965]